MPLFLKFCNAIVFVGGETAALHVLYADLLCNAFGRVRIVSGDEPNIDAVCFKCPDRFCGGRLYCIRNADYSTVHAVNGKHQRCAAGQSKLVECGFIVFDFRFGKKSFVPDKNAFAVDDRFRTASRKGFEFLRCGERNTFFRSIVRDCPRKRVFAGGLTACKKVQKLFFVNAVRNNFFNNWAPLCDCACFIKNNRVNFAGMFKSFTVFDKNAE